MITSDSNAQLKNVTALLKKSKERNEQKLFVVEGRKMFFEALLLQRVEKAFFSESFFNSNKELIETKCSEAGLVPDGLSFETVADNVFNKIAETVTPQGVLALVRMPAYSLEEICSTSRALVLLENLQDPGNLGTILRTAEAAGMDAVILSRDSVDVYNPKVVRSTMGSVFRVPFVYTDDFTAVVEELNRNGFNTIATHLSGKVSYTEADYSRKTAILIGNEGNGLTDEATAAASQKVIIPMSGHSESLNASVAAALMMYEVKRQGQLSE